MASLHHFLDATPISRSSSPAARLAAPRSVPTPHPRIDAHVPLFLSLTSCSSLSYSHIRLPAPASLLWDDVVSALACQSAGISTVLVARPVIDGRTVRRPGPFRSAFAPGLFVDDAAAFPSIVVNGRLDPAGLCSFQSQLAVSSAGTSLAELASRGRRHGPDDRDVRGVGAQRHRRTAPRRDRDDRAAAAAVPARRARGAVLLSPICKLLVEAVAGNACEELGHACVRAWTARRVCMSLLHAVWFVAVRMSLLHASCCKSKMACMQLHTPVVSCLSHRTNWWVRACSVHIGISEIHPATTMETTGEKETKEAALWLICRTSKRYMVI